VAATGPSLTPDVAAACRGHRVIAVNDAYRLLPFADILYACDAAWWGVHRGAPVFSGERWSCHGSRAHNDKLACADRYALNLVQGDSREGFSFDPARIHYGSNSGFQAINLGIHFGSGLSRRRILLVGFDMHAPGGRAHFFGDHPPGLAQDKNYGRFLSAFERAAKALPPGLKIINCTPGSALRCFPMADLNDALTAAA
jgi:hypothetical protein